ncbi:hypothetical protein B0T17DRAFT_644753, partial [Bombardia bombarda]
MDGIEPSHTKFNLTYPLSPFNDTAGFAQDGENVGENHSVIPGILFGILVPHIVCTVFILARTWSRLFLLRKWFLDDTLILLAWLFSTAVCIVYSMAAAQSPPRIHEQQQDTGDNTYVLRTYTGLICYQLCLLLTKLSILSFYTRIFSSTGRLLLARATVLFVVLFGVPLLVMSILQCHPITPGSFFFSGSGSPTNNSRCFAFSPLLIASASLHTATDAWLIALIVPCIVRLDLPPRQKAALAVVLSLSIFVIAASLIRLQLSLQANYRPEGGGVGADLGGGGVEVSNTLAFFVMTVLELDMALLCASAPTLRPVLARLWPRLGMGDAEGRGRGSGESGSVDLTSVVSYHGYPWTEPVTPVTGGSKNGSLGDLHLQHQQGMMVGPMMPPLPPPSVHRTPTTLSLRSFMSSMAPRSR